MNNRSSYQLLLLDRRQSILRHASDGFDSGNQYATFASMGQQYRINHAPGKAISHNGQGMLAQHRVVPVFVSTAILCMAPIFRGLSLEALKLSCT